jgi:hypothetical protein
LTPTPVIRVISAAILSGFLGPSHICGLSQVPQEGWH